MRILIRNLRNLRYSLDIGETLTGDIVRRLLAPNQQPGDTAEIGEFVDPWDLNMRERVRALVVPPGSTRVITPVTGGYNVTAVPPGQVDVTFLEDPDDLVFLFFGGSSTGDGKVFVDAADTTKDFLFAKLAAGTGIALTVLNPGGDEQIRIDTTGSSGLTPAQHEVLRQLIHFVDEGPGHGFAPTAYKVVTGSVFPTNITWYLDAAHTLKLVEKQITRSGGGATNVAPNPVVWIVYAIDGVTPLQTATDTISYAGVFETGRVRVFT